MNRESFSHNSLPRGGLSQITDPERMKEEMPNVDISGLKFRERYGAQLSLRVLHRTKKNKKLKNPPKKTSFDRTSFDRSITVRRVNACLALPRARFLLAAVIGLARARALSLCCLSSY